ncbi:MAG: PP2C family protein-serine/threonine phosphatase [Blastocatellia bacterium]|nr:PP2C family protein-serine/threonine phosphatase [Blastocatellia bacterium]
MKPASSQSFKFSPALVAGGVLAFVGLSLFVWLRHASQPDFGLFALYDRAELSRVAEKFVQKQTGYPAPGYLSQAAVCNTSAIEELKRKVSAAEMEAILRDNRLPVAISQCYWVHTDGRLAVAVNTDVWGNIVGYIQPNPALTRYETDEPDPAMPEKALVPLAENFIRQEIGLDLASFRPPTCKPVPGIKKEFEIRWERPLLQTPSLVETVTVHVRERRFRLFQRQVELVQKEKIMVAPVQGNFDMALLTMIATGPRFILIPIGLFYLIGIYRKQRLLMNLPFALVLLFGLLFLLNFPNMLPSTISQAMFNNPNTVGNTQAVEAFYTSGTQIILMTVVIVAQTAILGLMMCFTSLISFLAVTHLEIDGGLALSETFRTLVAGRSPGWRSLWQSLAVGVGGAWILLGIQAVITSRFPLSAYSVTAFTGIRFFLDAPMPNLFGVVTSLQFVITALFDIPFVWLLLTVRFKLSPKIVWPIVLVSHANLWLSGGFRFSWSVFLTSALGSLVLTLILKRYGIWPLVVSVWVFQFLSVASLAQEFPLLHSSPGLFLGLALLPAASLLLALRQPQDHTLDHTLVPTMLDGYLEQQRIERQLTIAQNIQTEFLPKACPVLPGWEIAARSEPAREVGGDFYDFLELEGSRLGIVIGDISGKSIPGALFMVVATTAFRSFAEENPQSCGRLLETLNKFLYEDMKRARMFAGAGYVVLNPATGELSLANAGLPQPLLYSVAARSSDYLDLNGIPLGSMRNSSYQEGEVVMKIGDILVLASDGVVEAMNHKDDQYGYEAFQKFIETHSYLAAHDLLDAIFKSVYEFAGETPQSDDITVVVVKRKR